MAEVWFVNDVGQPETMIPAWLHMAYGVHLAFERRLYEYESCMRLCEHEL